MDFETSSREAKRIGLWALVSPFCCYDYSLMACAVLLMLPLPFQFVEKFLLEAGTVDGKLHHEHCELKVELAVEGDL